MSRGSEPAYPGEIEVASTDPLTLRPVQTGPRSYKATGMTLREHFAGLAMQGMLASNAPLSAECIATYAPAYADALIAELEKAK